MDAADTVKPNFLIVGAAKSGTTSLYEYLRNHPDVFMPEWKEPAFFAPPDAGGITVQEEYLRLFENAAGRKAIGEASVAYLYAPEAPGLIRDFLGEDTKIIILLRNPVDAAYSLWGHQVREGYEDLSFEEAVASEEERMKDPDFGRARRSWLYDFAYHGRPDYMPQIERYSRFFPRDKIRIYIYEEFFVPGLPLFGDLCRFLCIGEDFHPVETKFNVAGRPRSKFLRHALKNKTVWKEPLKKIMPLRIRKSIRGILERYNRIDTPMPVIRPETKAVLEKKFDANVRRLEEYMGRSLKETWF